VVDGLAAAVDEDGSHADGFEEDHVGEELLDGEFILERAAPQLDDHDAVPKLSDPAHGFDEDVGFADGFVHVGESRCK